MFFLYLHFYYIAACQVFPTTKYCVTPTLHANVRNGISRGILARGKKQERFLHRALAGIVN